MSTATVNNYYLKSIFDFLQRSNFVLKTCNKILFLLPTSECSRSEVHC